MGRARPKVQPSEGKRNKPLFDRNETGLAGSLILEGRWRTVRLRKDRKSISVRQRTMKPRITILLGAVAAVLLPLGSWSATDMAAATGASEPIIPANLKLSQPARDVEKMATSGVSEDVIKTYIDSSPHTFNLSADNIIQMQGAGVSGGLTSEMLTHDKKVTDQAAASQPPFPAGQIVAPPQSPYPYPNTGTQTVAGQYQNQVAPYDMSQDLSPYYSELSPYGNWGCLPDYGWCWQPGFGLGYGGYPWGVLAGGCWWNCPGYGWCWFPGRGFRGRGFAAFGSRGFVGGHFGATFAGNASVSAFRGNRVSATRIGGGGFRSAGFSRSGGAHFSGGGHFTGGGHAGGGHR